MPLATRIDKDRQRVVVTGSGPISAEDAAGARQAILADPDFHPGCDGLADLTDSDLAGLTTDSIRLLSRGSPFGPQTRLAIVVGGPLAFGLVRMYEAFVEQSGGSSVRVFLDRHEAEAWLARTEGTM